MQKCRQCGYVGENDRDVRQHYKEVGHAPAPRKKRDATGYAVGALLPFDPQDEGAVISLLLRALDRANLPDDGKRRVIAYITNRYLPESKSP